MDRTPKKPCKHCRLMGHFSYVCFYNPKRTLKKLKRSPIKTVGKTTKQWLVTRAGWIRHNPPPIEGEYWQCYLRISNRCPVRINLTQLTLDHVVSRSRDPKLRFDLSNLKPACWWCNRQKGSRSLDQVKPATVL